MSGSGQGFGANPMAQGGQFRQLSQFNGMPKSATGQQTAPPQAAGGLDPSSPWYVPPPPPPIVGPTSEAYWASRGMPRQSMPFVGPNGQAQHYGTNGSTSDPNSPSYIPPSAGAGVPKANFGAPPIMGGGFMRGSFAPNPNNPNDFTTGMPGSFATGQPGGFGMSPPAPTSYQQAPSMSGLLAQAQPQQSEAEKLQNIISTPWRKPGAGAASGVGRGSETASGARDPFTMPTPGQFRPMGPPPNLPMQRGQIDWGWAGSAGNQPSGIGQGVPSSWGDYTFRLNPEAQAWTNSMIYQGGGRIAPWANQIDMNDYVGSIERLSGQKFGG